MGLAARHGAKRASIDISTATTTEVVAAPGAGKAIVVTNVVLTIISGNTAVWKSAATALCGAISTPGYVAGDGDNGILQCEDNEALNLTSTSTEAITGHITYVEVPD